MMTLLLVLVVLGHHLGHPRILQICPCNCAEFVALSVVFENLVVLIPHLVCSVSGPYFSDTDVDSASIIGIAEASDAAVPRPGSCSFILQFFLFDLHLGSTPHLGALLFSPCKRIIGFAQDTSP